VDLLGVPAVTHLTIRAACAATGLPRNRIFHLLLRKQLAYAQLEPDGPFLLDAEEVTAIGERGLAWARAWGAAHPVVRVDLLEDWAE
jgi:hypothetical protein